MRRPSSRKQTGVYVYLSARPRRSAVSRETLPRSWRPETGAAGEPALLGATFSARSPEVDVAPENPLPLPRMAIILPRTYRFVTYCTTRTEKELDDDG